MSRQLLDKINRTKNVNVVVFKSLNEPTTYTLFYAAATVSTSSILYKHIDEVISKKRQHVAAGLGGGGVTKPFTYLTTHYYLATH